MWEYRHTDELYHYGVLGMKWGKRKARYEYKYAYDQKPKNTYQKVARSIGGTNFAKKAILNSNRLSNSQKRIALKEQEILADEKAYNKASKKAFKTGGTVTYDVPSKSYSVSKPSNNRNMTTRAMKKLSKQKIKDLEKEYGKLEDLYTYGKNENKEKNRQLDKQMNLIEKQIEREEKRIKNR